MIQTYSILTYVIYTYSLINLCSRMALPHSKCLIYPCDNWLDE